MLTKESASLCEVDGVSFPEVSLEKLIWMLEIYLHTAGETLERHPKDTGVLFLATLSGNSLVYLRVLHDGVKGLENARDAAIREHLKKEPVTGRPQ